MAVVHWQREGYDVYIGRGNGEHGKWGNPFVLDCDGERPEMLEQYRRWLWFQIKEGTISVRELAELDGKILGCWCAPKRCHGEVLESAARWAAQQGLDR